MKLYAVSDDKWLHIAEYEVEKETDSRYYLKGAMTKFVGKKNMFAYWGEKYFLTQQEAAEYLVDLGEARIAKAQEAIERDRKAVEKHRALARVTAGKEE